MSDLSTQIAVLETQMKQIAKQVDEGFSNISHQFDVNSNEHKEMVAMFQKAMEQKADKDKVDSLADNQKWIVRLIVGIVATAVVGLVVKTNL